jgi:hypothetical protein
MRIDPEHDPEKHALGPDPGWNTGFRKKTMLKQWESDGLMQRSWIRR